MSGDETISEGAEEPLSKDTVFGILANERRRLALLKLRDHPESTVPLSELADRVTAAEKGVSVESVSASQRKKMYVGLYQVHLPQMDSENVVKFDQDRGKVSLGPYAPKLLYYLDIDGPDE